MPSEIKGSAAYINRTVAEGKRKVDEVILFVLGRAQRAAFAIKETAERQYADKVRQSKRGDDWG